jgi:hypothetical protein
MLASCWFDRLLSEAKRVLSNQTLVPRWTRDYLLSLRRETQAELFRLKWTLMDWLLRLVVIWFSLDVVIIATGWYAKSTIKVQFPNWWRRVICDKGPEIEPEFV